MPRTVPPSRSSSEDTKPYPTSSPTKPSSPKRGGVPKPWSREDKLKMLLIIVDAGLEGKKVDFAGMAEVFPGRTKSQCYDQWRQQILPALKKDGSVMPTGGRT